MNVKVTRSLPAILAFVLCSGPAPAAGSVFVMQGAADCGGSVANAWNPRAEQRLDTIESLECDYSDPFATFSGQAATFGGDTSFQDLFAEFGQFAVEPMAHAVAGAGITLDPTGMNRPYVSLTAGAEVQVSARVVPRGALPDGWTASSLVPVHLFYALHVTSTAQGTASASVSFTGGGLSWAAVSQGLNYETAGVEDFSLGMGSLYSIRAVAMAGVLVADTRMELSANAQAVADPFLTIDPAWPHAALFRVEQNSMLHPGEWIEVTRVWQDSAPPTGSVVEPPLASLMLAGLAGLTLTRRRATRPAGSRLTSHR